MIDVTLSMFLIVLMLCYAIIIYDELNSISILLCLNLQFGKDKFISKKSKKVKDFCSEFYSFLLEDDPKTQVIKQYYGFTYKSVDTLTNT